jgi:hypothetical protein
MRPFKCQHCNQAYKRASHLRRHEESTHGTIFKPRRLQRLGHDETGALVPIVEESKSSSGGVKDEPSVAPPDQQWTSPATSQGSVFTNPVLSLVDADSGKVITLQELCSVSDAQILTTTGDLSTTEVLTLPPDDTLTTIVTCADGTTLDSFQSGEVMQTIEVTYDLSFPTSQTLTTVLSNSEPRLVFATPITMSLDQHQTVLTVSEVQPADNLDGKVQLLETQDASKLPDTIFIEEGKLEGLDEPMLLENFSALDDRVMQTQVIGTTVSSAMTLPNLPNSVETVLQLHPEQLPVSTDCSLLPSDVLTTSSLLRERLMSRPKLRSSTLPPLALVPAQCVDDLDTTTMSSISDSSIQPDSGISTLSVSPPVPGASTDGSHLDSMLPIPNSVQPSYAGITVENIDPDSVITSFSVPNSIQPTCGDISSGGTSMETSVSQLSIPDSALPPHSDISPKDSCPSTDVPSISIPNSLCVTHPTVSSASKNPDSSISALIVPNTLDTVGSCIPVKSVNLIDPLFPNISDKKNDSEATSALIPNSAQSSHSDIDSEATSALIIPNSAQSSHSDIDCIHTDTSVSTLSVGALDISISETGIHPSCTVSIQPQNSGLSVEGTHTDLVLASLPLSADGIHSSSSCPNAVQSSCSDESTNPTSNMMPDFLPQNFPFLNVE